ncbi:substrate-binding domain-containing protein [Bradyrhizobium sp. USDA 4353]
MTKGKGRFSSRAMIGAGIFALLLLAGAVYLFVANNATELPTGPARQLFDLATRSDVGAAQASQAPDVIIQPAAAALPSASPSTLAPEDRVPPKREPVNDYLVRLNGSNTIGAKLAPDLAEAWLRSMGASEVRRLQRTDPQGVRLPEFVISGDLGGRMVGVEVKAHGTGTGAKALRNLDADIWMASVPVSDEQASMLASVGDMRSARSEHVVGLDGIAVIVSPSSRLRTLTKAQVKDIFTGRLTDWSALGLPAGPINLYARDGQSGTRKTFEELVLGPNTRMAPLTPRQPNGYEDSEQLSDDVASDPNGIGFVGMAYVGAAKALSISDGNAIALAPTEFTVRTENYPLSRRLFLYSADQPRPEVSRFIKFALSKEGQDVAQKTVVGLSPNAKPAAEVDSRPCALSAKWTGNPQEFCQLRAQARALDVSFRFQSDSFELDNLAAPNLYRVMQALRETPQARLLLAGFADRRGSYQANCRLSLQRAESVKQGLASLGISNVETRGYCDEVPVRDNGGDEFEKNRRVEIFVLTGPAVAFATKPRPTSKPRPARAAVEAAPQ